MNPFSAAIYLIGDGNCHQLSERSLYLNGNQMPFCARDVGIFLGLAIGMLIVLLALPAVLLDRASILLALPILIDGGVQYVGGGYESTNALRLLTGMLGGCGGLLLPGLRGRPVADRKTKSYRTVKKKK